MQIEIHLDHITFLDQSVTAVEDGIEAAMAPFPPPGESAPAFRPPTRPGHRRHGRREPARGDPRRQCKLAMAVIVETGLDMTRFPTADHLVSCAGLAPGTQRRTASADGSQQWGNNTVLESDQPRRLVHTSRSLYDPDLAGEPESRVT